MIWLNPVDNNFYFTLWGSNINIISLFLSIVAGTETYHTSKSLRNFTGILCELAFAFQVLITTVYWPVLHPWVLEVLLPEISQTDETLAEVMYYLNVFIHSVPLVAAMINVALSRIVF